MLLCYLPKAAQQAGESGEIEDLLALDLGADYGRH